MTGGQPTRSKPVKLGKPQPNTKGKRDPNINKLGMNINYWYINGVAYDFSKFLQRHPGGTWALNLGKGRECIGLIQSYHLKVPSEELLAKYRLPDSEQPSQKIFQPVRKISYEPNGFYATVKREAVDYFEKNNLSHKAPWLHIFMFIFNVISMLASLYFMIEKESLFFGFLHGVLRSILVVQTTHGASHFSFSHSPSVNRWAYRIGTILIGLWAPTTWDVQHVVAHHVYTNEWPYDTDSAFPIKSIFANQRRFWYHRYQHVYMWVVYAFTIPLVMLNSFKDIIVGKQVLFRLRYHQATDYPEAIICSVGAFVYLLTPFFFLPFSTALYLTVFSSVVSSLYFSLQFVVNHEVDNIIQTEQAKAENRKPVPPATGMLPPSEPEGTIDWGAYQLANSLTFAPGSRLALEAAGGLNTQVEHHLFPGVHYSHYGELTPIIMDCAKRFGLKYHSKANLWEAVIAHYRLLRDPPASVRSGKDKSL